jgi:SPASM domain peptide maturase of grasp-with-spasm system
MEEHTPFRLFAHCFAVQGYSRGLICDLQRNRMHPVPNILCDLLQEEEPQTIAALKARYDHQHDAIIEDYFRFLYEEELIFFTGHPEWFPPMDLQWHHPAAITNAILDFGISPAYDLEEALHQLDGLHCAQVELRCYGTPSPSFYDELLATIHTAAITSVGILSGYNDKTPATAWRILCDKHPRITSVVVYGCPEEQEQASEQFMTPVRFTGKQITGAHCCGVVNESYFGAYTETFTEALQYNSCLHRKLGIDKDGYIKNCPSMQLHFGNIKDISLEEALQHPGFKQHWPVTKDKVAVCRDCEFRYVCTDCRAYLEDPGDSRSKPLKCGYDPYTCTWQDWSRHPLKQAAIDHYGMR